MRGGVSRPVQSLRSSLGSSPRAWGCFSFYFNATDFEAVFPTCVGVFLFHVLYIHSYFRLPHVRGGVSRDSVRHARGFLSSPRAWGCFSVPTVNIIPDTVFPTCVGVFPSFRNTQAHLRRLPHVRGGVSSAAPYRLAAYSLPHVRGGVSFAVYVLDRHNMSSPRAWGCFF